MKKKLIITSIGRRVELIKHLQQTFYIIGVDASAHNAARCFTDEFYIIPKCDGEGYIDSLLQLSKEHDVRLLIPLYEKEFDILCQYRSEFEKHNTKLLLSDREIIRICNDKNSTQEFFEKEHIKAPKLTNHAPAVVKPVYGMGSMGVFLAETDEELKAAQILSKDYIIQEKIKGAEYTIDVLCDFSGNVISAVPRLREEIRSGEVSKSRTEHDVAIIEATVDLIKKLNHYGKVIGPITVQCFKNNENEVIFLEINPRFGGGVPLTFAAGVDYGNILEKCISGQVIAPIIGRFKDMEMMRYDQAVYIERRND